MHSKSIFAFSLALAAAGPALGLGAGTPAAPTPPPAGGSTIAAGLRQTLEATGIPAASYGKPMSVGKLTPGIASGFQSTLGVVSAHPFAGNKKREDATSIVARAVGAPRHQSAVHQNGRRPGAKAQHSRKPKPGNGSGRQHERGRQHGRQQNRFHRQAHGQQRGRHQPPPQRHPKHATRSLSELD